MPAQIRYGKINIITIFPYFFESPLKVSLLGKAIQKKILEINLIDLRDFAVSSSGKIDDLPYGGGPGMVFMIEPIDRAIQKIRSKEKSHVILLAPKGRRFQQKIARELFDKITQGVSLTLVCGHYEGVDERVNELVADESLSIGDFILSGGEIASLALIESVARFIPGFMKNQESLCTDSFSQEGYLEYPQYTRPAIYRGIKVPDVLISGHHEEIRKWRERNSRQSKNKELPQD